MKGSRVVPRWFVACFGEQLERWRPDMAKAHPWVLLFLGLLCVLYALWPVARVLLVAGGFELTPTPPAQVAQGQSLGWCYLAVISVMVVWFVESARWALTPPALLKALLEDSTTAVQTALLLLAVDLVLVNDTIVAFEDSRLRWVLSWLLVLVAHVVATLHTAASCENNHIAEEQWAYWCFQNVLAIGVLVVGAVLFLVWPGWLGWICFVSCSAFAVIRFVRPSEVRQ